MLEKEEVKMANLNQRKRHAPRLIMERVKKLLDKYKTLRLKKLGLVVLKKVMPTQQKKQRRHSVAGRDNNNVSKEQKYGQVVPICKDDYSLGELLGAGGFGSVFKASHKQCKSQLAIKVLKKPSLCKNPAAQMESYKAEVQCLTLRHRNLVRIIGTTELDTFESGVWIVMEYSGDRTLQKTIDDPHQELCCDTRIRLAFQLSSALKYLHGNNIIHQDVKPCNIMITPSGDCKLGDFGCSQKLESMHEGNVSPTQRSHLTGTFAYRAPELLRGLAPSTKADVYGCGITLWQMFSRESPYRDTDQHVVIFGVVAYGQRPKHPDIDENDAFELCYRDLYSQCWEASPENRPSSDELVEVLKIWKSYL